MLQLDATFAHGRDLLAAEEARVARIDQLAEEMLASEEHAGPAREPPCGKERDECLRCYEALAGGGAGALQCAGAVEAFTSCAMRAQEDFLLRSAGAGAAAAIAVQ